MSEFEKPDHWTAQQWSKAQQVVHDTARQARVAARFLPLFGPLPDYAETVPTETVEPQPNPQPPPPQRLHVDSSNVLRLNTIGANIPLTTRQHAQPDLESAVTLFTRAAGLMAMVEDGIIFRGEDYLVQPPIYTVSRKPDHWLTQPPIETVIIDSPSGRDLVNSVVKGIVALTGNGYPAPYALVFGDQLFVDVETPERDSMVLPSDRIKPIIEGPLLRSPQLLSTEGVLVALAGNPIEIVMAEDMHVSFLQVSTEPRYIYRVSERLVLRIKDFKARVLLRLKTNKGAKDGKV